MFFRLKFILLPIIVCILSQIKLCLSDDEVKVNLKQGTLSGKVEKTFLKQQIFYSFKGIPFAEPPVGNLRFKPPKQLSSWDGILEAYDNKPTCVQGSARQRNNEPPGISGSEDCLYLNVFTPRLEGTYPVVVFDYSDNFRTGFNWTKTYSPDFFLEEDVIVVMISHRLGVLGYLNTEDEIIPGNAGVKDFLLGLQWVKDNIEKFGGDPSKVTLMGNRGGAVLSNILLYSKKASGLFTGVTLQSGSAFEAIFFPKNSRDNAFKLAGALNITADDSTTLLDQLQKVNASVLVMNDHEAISNDIMNKYQMTVYPFGPVIEPPHPDAVLTVLPENAEIVNDVPVLLGYNSRDGLDFVSHYLFQPRLVNEMKNDFLFLFPIRTDFRFDINSSIYQNALTEIKTFYFKVGYFYPGNILEYSVYVGDILQTYASDYAVKKLSEDLTSPLYYYVFDFKGALNENFVNLARYSMHSMRNYGATMTDELCYLHLCSRIQKQYIQLNKLLSQQPEIKVMKNMVKLWTNFAKTGNPTPGDDADLKGVTWEPVNKETKVKKFLHIAKKIKMKAEPIDERAKFWDNFLERYSEMAIDGVVGNDDEKVVNSHDDIHVEL